MYEDSRSEVYFYPFTSVDQFCNRVKSVQSLTCLQFCKARASELTITLNERNFQISVTKKNTYIIIFSFGPQMALLLVSMVTWVCPNSLLVSRFKETTCGLLSPADSRRCKTFPLNSFPRNHPWRPGTPHTCAIVQNYVPSMFISFINFIWNTSAELLKIPCRFVFWQANVQSKWKRILSRFSSAVERSLQTVDTLEQRPSW